MHLLDPTYIRDNCDYSFGDESSLQIGGYMKPANRDNHEFISLCNDSIGKKPYLTLFIDNIRLYRRDGVKYTALEQHNPEIARIKDEKVARLAGEDLLALCASMPDMRFVIFTGFEDTPIDDDIFKDGVIPHNVIRIFASNAICFRGKVIPIPYGIQRKLGEHDHRHQVLTEVIEKPYLPPLPDKLLYINHSLDTNPERKKINGHFSGKGWVSIEHPRGIDPYTYRQYLYEIQKHKFVLCPSGNAIGCECHRDWETLYMRRVPVVLRSHYLEYMFDGFPVLFVDDFEEVTGGLLCMNNHLYEEAQHFNITKLDYKRIFENILSWVDEIQYFPVFDFWSNSTPDIYA